MCFFSILTFSKFWNIFMYQFGILFGIHLHGNHLGILIAFSEAFFRYAAKQMVGLPFFMFLRVVKRIKPSYYFA